MSISLNVHGCQKVIVTPIRSSKNVHWREIRIQTANGDNMTIHLYCAQDGLGIDVKECESCEPMHDV